MPKLLILARQADKYHQLVEAAKLPELELVSTLSVTGAVSIGESCEILFGEPSLIREVLPAMTNLRWAQSTWAGVEPLLDPSLRAPRGAIKQYLKGKETNRKVSSMPQYC